MEALQIELYFSIFVGAFMLGFAIFLFFWVKRKAREDEEKANK